MLQRLALIILGVSAGCGTTVTTTPDADVGVDATGAADADTTAPYLGDVLECGQAGPAGGIGAGTALQRVDLDTTVFPEALCNDGTAAFFYFRPATVAAMSDRWVIQLQGGGSCNTPDSCAERWCSVDTNFGAQGMTNTLSPPVGIRGDGILQQGGAAGQPNPVGAWNHVFVRYCSSDSWTGTAGPVDVDGHDPITGEPVRYRIAFSGSLILDAVLATLRRDGAAPPAYTLDGGPQPLADLDDAAAVILAGGSAGGAGVTENVDRVREVLRAHNPAIETMGLIDSIFSPSLEGLDFSTTTMCAEGICDYQAWEETAAAFSLHEERHDDSCATWHAANEPETAWKCNDGGHIQRHHITTPILIRQGLLDDNIAGHTIDAMFTVPGRGLMSRELFAELVATQLSALPGSTPEEAFEQPPAVFAPPCAAHETMSDNQATYDTTLTSDGTPYTMFEVLMNAAAGTSPTALVWGPGDPIDCGP